MKRSAAQLLAVSLFGPQIRGQKTAESPIELRLRGEKIVASVPQEFDTLAIRRELPAVMMLLLAGVCAPAADNRRGTIVIAFT